MSVNPSIPKLVALHQTTVVSAQNIAPVSFLTIPMHDIVADKSPTDTSRFETIVSGLIGRTGPVLSYDKWSNTLQAVLRKDSWNQVEEIGWSYVIGQRFGPSQFNNPPGLLRTQWSSEAAEFHTTLQNALPKPAFGEALLQTLVAGPSLFTPQVSSKYGYQSSISQDFLPARLQALYAVVDLNKRVLQLEDAEVALWVDVAGVISASKSKSVIDIANSLRNFDIPYGMSPTTNKANVTEILSNARNIVYLPLAAGAVEAAHYVTQGDFVMAIQTAGAGGATMLVLVGAATLTERTLSWLKGRLQ